MSWFPQHEGDALADVPESIDPDELAGTEVGPGVFLARRHFLQVSAGLTAALGLAGAAGAAAPPRAAGGLPAEAPCPTFPPVTFDSYVLEARRLAQALLRQRRPGEETYLFHLASLLLRVGSVPVPRYFGKFPITSDIAFHHGPLMVYHFRLAPCAKIPLHDHHQYNGVILGVRGQAQVRNFDIVDPESAPKEAGKPFRLRETIRCTLTPGRVSMLSRRRDNLHELAAGPDGAEFLDVFTYFSRDARSYALDFKDKPVPGEANVYEASWKQKRG